MARLADRMSRLEGEAAMEVLARAKEMEAGGREIVHLELGEPNFDTPEHIISAGITAMQAGKTRYSPAPGLLSFRKAIAEDIGLSRGIEVNPENVIVAPGAKPVIFLTLLMLCQPGDEVIHPDPGFPAYHSMVNFVGARSVPLPMREERDFSVDPEELGSLITDRTKLIILNSPGNPTGGVIPKDDLEGIAEQVLARLGVMVLSDEIYSRLVYDGEFKSIASFPGMAERTILLDGFSKTFAMPGWRLGYGVVPSNLREAFILLAINNYTCTAEFTQYAGMAALTGPQEPIEEMVEGYRYRRDLIVDGLNALPGFRCRKPQGAFYAFPNVHNTGLTAEALAEKLLVEAGVALLPGGGFGECGKNFLRISFANSVENLKLALDRMAQIIRI